MKGSSEVIMGTTLVMVASLAIVLGLVLVLLAELYCSLLLRRRQRHLGHTTSSLTTTATGAFSHPKQTKPPDQPASALPLSSFYAQGVLQAPRSFLFPALPNNEVKASMMSQQPQAHQAREFQDQLELSSTPHRLGLLNPSPSSPSFVSPTSPHSILKVSLQCGNSRTSNRVTCDGGGEEHIVYISNPIYDNEASMPSRLQDTPFETPDISPSRLDMAISSDDKERSSSPSSPSSLPSTPPLTPMKKLPAEACSVSLRDARSLATSGSDSNTIISVSSSSSGSPCTSPSW